MTIEDIEFAQKRLADIREHHETLKASIEALHEKNLAAAKSPEEIETENKRHKDLTQKTEHEFKMQERQALDDVKRMEDHMPRNQNLHAVGESQAAGEPPQPYVASATVGVPQFNGLPLGKTANDSEPTEGPPGGPDGPGSGATKAQAAPGAKPASSSPNESVSSAASEDKIKNDFSAPPPPIAPPPPTRDNEHKLAR